DRRGRGPGTPGARRRGAVRALRVAARRARYAGRRWTSAPRRSPGSGTPPAPAAPAAAVDRALDAAGPVASGAAVVAVVAPHAGHVYSGGVAGHAFAAVRGLAPELVAVVGPMHVPARGAL